MRYGLAIALLISGLIVSVIGLMLKIMHWAGRVPVQIAGVVLILLGGVILAATLIKDKK